MELILLHKHKISQAQVSRISFNPCFIGTYSFTTSNGISWPIYRTVLILVLLELILLRSINAPVWKFSICFNPCFIGTYSFTYWRIQRPNIWNEVLILVLLELILLQCMDGILGISTGVLILVLLELILLQVKLSKTIADTTEF